MRRVAGAERPRGWASLPHTDSDSDVQKRLDLMDEAGVEVQVLSHGSMAPCERSEAGAMEAARACNDGYAEHCHKHPPSLRGARLSATPVHRCRTFRAGSVHE